MTPILGILTFYIIGILFSNTIILSFSTTVILLSLFFFLIFLIKKYKLKKYYFAVYLIFILIGIGYGNFLLNGRKQAKEKTVNFEGTIISEIQEKKGFSRFKIHISSTNQKTFHKNSLGYWNTKILPLQTGMKIKGYGILKVNNSRYFLGKNLWGSLNIEFIETAKKQKNYYYFISKIRQSIYNIITRNINDDSKFVIAALVLGENKNLSSKTRQFFSNSGTIHILAVSGLHLGLIALLVFGISGLFLRERKKKLIVLAIFVVLYALLIGDRISIIRAALMTELGILMYFLDSDKNYFNVLGLSAAIMLFYNPFALYDLGFQLSFSAVLGLLVFNQYFSRIFKNIPKIMRDSLSATFSAQMFVLPIILINFHKIIIFSFFANFFIVPLAGAVIILGFSSFFLGIMHLGFLVSKINLLNSLFAKIMLWVASVFANLPFAKIDYVNIFFLLGIIFLIGCFIVFIYKPQKKLLLPGLVISLVVFIYGLYLLGEPSTTIIVPSIGKFQNLVLVKSENKNLLIIKSKDYFYERIEKFLLQNNIESLDYIYDFNLRQNNLALRLTKEFDVDKVINFQKYRKLQKNCFMTLRGYGVKYHDHNLECFFISPLPKYYSEKILGKKSSFFQANSKLRFIYLLGRSTLKVPSIVGKLSNPADGIREYRINVKKGKWKRHVFKW